MRLISSPASDALVLAPASRAARGSITEPMLVRGEPMRAKFRKSWSKPEQMKPNEVTHIPFAMPDINHTFKKGHRIMIHVQSSWFPLVDRNPQKFLNIYQAKGEDFQKATQRIYRSAKFPTNLKVGVLKP